MSQVVGTSGTSQKNKNFYENNYIIGGTNEDNLSQIINTSDGGYLLIGDTQSDGAGGADGIVIKLKANGRIDWAKTYGGTNTEDFNGGIEIAGNYYVVGETRSDGAGNYDAIVMKIDPSGNIIWNRTIGGTAYDYFFTVTETGDGNLVAVGNTLSDGAGDADVFLVKINSSTGAIIWDRTIGGSDYEYIGGIVKTADDGFVFAGETYSDGLGSNDCYVVKVNASGTVIWDKTIGGTQDDWCESVTLLKDGNVAVVGNTESDGAGDLDVLIAKLNQSDGSLIWAKTFGGPLEDWAENIITTRDGNLVIASGTDMSGGTWEGHGFKLNQLDGSLMWSRLFGDSDNGDGTDSWFYNLVETTDGGILFGGMIRYYGSGNRDINLLKLSPGGNFPGGHPYIENDAATRTLSDANNAGNIANADDADTEANADNSDTEANADNANTVANADDADNFFVYVAPNAFNFIDQTNVALSTTIQSNIIQITGLKYDVQVWISNGSGSPEYRICSDASCSSVVLNWTSTDGQIITNNQYLQLRRSSSSSNNNTRSTNIWVGAHKDIWSFTTLP